IVDGQRVERDGSQFHERGIISNDGRLSGSKKLAPFAYRCRSRRPIPVPEALGHAAGTLGSMPPVRGLAVRSGARDGGSRWGRRVGENTLTDLLQAAASQA